MNYRQEVENRIFNDWVDPQVALWVIRQLTLLELEGKQSPCSIFSLSLDSGLYGTDQPLAVDDFKNTPKLVISGGFEGTKGHLEAIRDLDEIRALTANEPTLITLLLEPDSYIERKKGRQPLLNFDQRKYMWSTSGRVDAIILLPGGADRVESERFLQIHEHIKPALWCTNVENPHWKEIITRPNQPVLDIIRLLKHNPEIHASFLNSTKDIIAADFTEKLYEYLFNQAQNPDACQVPSVIPPDIFAQAIFNRLMEDWPQ